MKPNNRFSRLQKTLQYGFTLVELLIVVIILAVLAAIVVPQFSGSTDDAKLSALDANLANIRSAISLYRQQHGALPGAVTAVPSACDGTPGTGDATSAKAEETFLDQMAFYTKINGEACTKATDTSGDIDFNLGPYLQKRELPPNPFTGSNALVVSDDGDLNMSSSSTTGGWKYDRVTGKFIADHTDYDER